MSLRKLTAGDGYSYLTRQVAAHDTTEKGHTSLADYYSEKGESPGVWMGAGLASLGMADGESVTASQMAALFGQGQHPRSAEIEAAMAVRGRTAKEIGRATSLGRAFSVRSASSDFNIRLAEAFTAYNLERAHKWNAPIDPEERARIRTELGNVMFFDTHGRHPQNAREISGYIAKASRQATRAIAGFDLSFSPVKSVSTLWALAPAAVSSQVRAAHDAAVADTLHWLEREVAHTRVGRAGARQVNVRGLVAAAFTHRDSRAGDPDLHTHVAISNKVQTEDGRWLALDGRMIYAAKVAASEHYNTRIEAELVERLGVEFVERDQASPGKRPVREIRGISTTLSRFWSRRRTDIVARQSELASEFQRRFGRPPTAVEAIWQADQANLETRAPKHGPRSESEQRDTWRAEADAVLGGAAEVDEMLARVTGRGAAGQRLTREWVEDAADAMVEAIEASRATWNIWHLTAEAQRQVRRARLVRPDAGAAVELAVEAAISRCVRLGVDDPVAEPTPLRRCNGESVYDVHGARLYSSARILCAEQEILESAGRTGGHKLADSRVEVALSASAAGGLELNDAQSAMVRDLATSGARVQLALAPAGTGKTTAMSVLAGAWTGSGGQVIGLAPSAQAAHELGDAVSGHTDTLAKLTWSLANEPSAAWPKWISAIGPRSMVIIDEAGQAATTELAAAIRFVLDRGGVVRLIGDDQQLAAVGAGGVLRDIQRSFGASALSEVRRFHDPAEAAATLAVREGDSSALGFYADNSRIHVGDVGTVADLAYSAWSADRDAGLDSLLLAPTRELVGQLNARARSDRLATSGASGPCVELADGNGASAGDIIITRRNNRRLVVSRSNWVKNGDRWQVEQVTAYGSIVARHLELSRTVELPAGYVAEHVQLGYATTVHGAQGMTTDSAHLVATGDEMRQTLYVGLSRGRAGNHVYLATGHDGDRHSLIDVDTLRPPTAIDVLTAILERDGSDRSATTTHREAVSYSDQLHSAAMRYADSLGFAAEHVFGVEAIVALERDIEAIWPGLTSEPSYPNLREQLCVLALGSADPLEALLDAANQREMTTSEDRAAVLGWRISRSSDTGPLEWLDAIPIQLLEDPVWGDYLSERARRVRALSEAVRCEAKSWSPTTAPDWATIFTAPQHEELRGDLAIWRSAFAIPDTDRRPTGRQQSSAATAAHQAALARRARAVRGQRRANNALIDRLPDEVTADPEFPRLAERLGSLQAAGVDVLDMLVKALESARPLPDERSSDALWWRIVRHLGPAALRASASQARTLRPAWSAHLCERLGGKTGERVMADAMWPALVAAIRARPAHWTPEQLIDAAVHGPEPSVRDDLCAALAWRIATMTDEPFDDTELIEPEYEASNERPSPPTAITFETSATAARIVELNEWALAFFESAYGRSWAPDYLTHRLGTDLAEDPRFRTGYAPPGPASLLNHLTARGATVNEVIDAGLARTTEGGRVLDAFRDRLVFPIYSDSSLVGFVGRRNPHRPDTERSGPKYLNTRRTSVFVKGEVLYGLAESASDLAAGAKPVLVEGPLDAIAISLATGGTHVGLAPLGTALTDAQVERLKPYVATDPDRVVIATDSDSAGRESARKGFWRLAAVRANPQYLALPSGTDPADILQAEGTESLLERLKQVTALAPTLVSRLFEARPPAHADALARVDLARAAARIIGAVPPNRWLEFSQGLAERLDMSPATIQEEILEAGAQWTNDPYSCAARGVAATWPSEPQEIHTRRPSTNVTPASRQKSPDLGRSAARTIDR